MNKIRNWISDRLGLESIRDTVLKRRVAKTPWYYGDGAALTLLLTVLVVTGIVMTLTYSPSPESAYASVQYLTEEQTLGGFIRALHYWSAGMMVVMLFVHLFRQILVAGYKFPREATWLFGTLLFFAVLAMSFTGYLLRWDERAIHAVRVMLHTLDNVPLVGSELAVLVQGGDEPGALLLTRIYATHVIILPLFILTMLAFHLFLVIHHGNTSLRERRELIHTVEQQKRLYREQADSERDGETFFPDTVARSGLVSVFVFGVTLTLALVYGPAKLYPEANLIDPSMPIEEWWFWWYSALIALLPSWLAPTFVFAFPLVVLILMVLLPFIDRGPKRGMRKRPLAIVFVMACSVALVALTALRRESPWTGWPMDAPPPVPEGVVLAPEAERGRLLYVQYGCINCHAVMGHGRKVAVDLATTEGRMSRQEYRDFILQPPDDVAMPAYEGRIPDEDLEHLLDYVHAAQTFPRQE